ncbi:alpha/beta fold hydrolase [Nocardia abscessus]|uniref:alpha/beta fold hydrolase n=1 Tax=Nocardia abscessus TaxID=120957 RepID=UPI002458B461|nr:alpha/beta fold hydrolase [Nocardia abscessus]
MDLSIKATPDENADEYTKEIWFNQQYLRDKHPIDHQNKFRYSASDISPEAKYRFASVMVAGAGSAVLDDVFPALLTRWLHGRGKGSSGYQEDFGSWLESQFTKFSRRADIRAGNGSPDLALDLDLDERSALAESVVEVVQAEKPTDGQRVLYSLLMKHLGYRHPSNNPASSQPSPVADQSDHKQPEPPVEAAHQRRMTLLEYSGGTQTTAGQPPADSARSGSAAAPRTSEGAIDPICVVGAFADARDLGFDVQQPVDVTGPVPPAAVAWLAGAHHQRFDGGLAEIAQLLTRQGTGAGRLVNARPVGAAIGHLFLLHNDGKQIWIHDQHAQQPKKVFDPEDPPFAAETTHALRLTRRDGASTLELRQQQLGENNPDADPDIARGRALRPADAGALPPDDHTSASPDDGEALLAVKAAGEEALDAAADGDGRAGAPRDLSALSKEAHAALNTAGAELRDLGSADQIAEQLMRDGLPGQTAVVLERIDGVDRARTLVYDGRRVVEVRDPNTDDGMIHEFVPGSGATEQTRALVYSPVEAADRVEAEQALGRLLGRHDSDRFPQHFPDGIPDRPTRAATALDFDRPRTIDGPLQESEWSTLAKLYPNEVSGSRGAPQSARAEARDVWSDRYFPREPVPASETPAQYLARHADVAIATYSNTYRAGENDGIHGWVDQEGVLLFQIGAAEGTPSGQQMFRDLMAEIGSHVRAIRAPWSVGDSFSDNIDTFNAYRQDLGLSPEDAARRTFTGKMAGGMGFTEVTVNHLIGPVGEHLIVDVTFSRPTHSPMSAGRPGGVSAQQQTDATSKPEVPTADAAATTTVREAGIRTKYDAVPMPSHMYMYTPELAASLDYTNVYTAGGGIYDEDAPYTTGPEGDVFFLTANGDRSMPAPPGTHTLLYSTFSDPNIHVYSFGHWFMNGGRRVRIIFGSNMLPMASADLKYVAQGLFEMAERGVPVEFDDSILGDLWRMQIPVGVPTAGPLIDHRGESPHPAVPDARTMFPGATAQFWMYVTAVVPADDSLSIVFSINPVLGKPGRITLVLTRENDVITAKYTDIALGEDADRVTAAIEEFHTRVVDPWLTRSGAIFTGSDAPVDSATDDPGAQLQELRIHLESTRAELAEVLGGVLTDLVRAGWVRQAVTIAERWIRGLDEAGWAAVASAQDMDLVVDWVALRLPVLRDIEAANAAQADPVTQQQLADSGEELDRQLANLLGLSEPGPTAHTSAENPLMELRALADATSNPDLQRLVDAIENFLLADRAVARLEDKMRAGSERRRGQAAQPEVRPPSDSTDITETETSGHRATDNPIDDAEQLGAAEKPGPETNETTAVHGHDAARIAPDRDLVQQTRARRDSVAEELSINPAELQPGSLRIMELQDELNELRTKLAPLAGVPRSELTDEQPADRRRAAALDDLIEATTTYHELDERTAQTNAVEPGQVRAPVGRTIVEGLGLPAEVATAEIIGEDPTAALLPQEQALIDAIQSDPEGVREREIVYGRTCAHRALARLGVPVEPVLRAGENAPGGMPLWQPGIAGSISHTLGFTLTQKTGYYVAAVSRHHRSIGIDAAHNEPISDVLRNRVALPEEQAWLSRIGTHRGVHWGRVLFSAKESVYKAWYPLTHRALDFEDALITFDLDAGTFTARLLVEDRSTLEGQPLTELHGRFLIDGGVILTGIAVPQSDQSGQAVSSEHERPEHLASSSPDAAEPESAGLVQAMPGPATAPTEDTSAGNSHAEPAPAPVTDRTPPPAGKPQGWIPENRAAFGIDALGPKAWHNQLNVVHQPPVQPFGPLHVKGPNPEGWGIGGKPNRQPEPQAQHPTEDATTDQPAPHAAPDTPSAAAAVPKTPNHGPADNPADDADVQAAPSRPVRDDAVSPAQDASTGSVPSGSRTTATGRDTNQGFRVVRLDHPGDRAQAEESVRTAIEEAAPQWPTVARAAAVETARAVVADAARHGATRQRVEAPHADVLRVIVEHEGAADLAPELVQTLDAGSTSWRAESYDTGSHRVVCDFHLRGDSVMAPEPADASAKLADDPVVASRVVRVGPMDEASPTIRALAFVMIRPDMPFWNHIGPAVNEAAALAETLLREVSQGRQAVTATASITKSGRWTLEVVEDAAEIARAGRIVFRPSEYRPLGNSAADVLNRATASLSDRARSSKPEAAPASALPDAADGVTDVDSLRVVTWNFAGARRSRSDEAFDYIPDPSYFVRELPEIGAQIVFFQESEVGPNGSNARELADALGYRNVYETVMCPSHMDTTKAISLAVVTDLPIEAGLEVLLPATGLELTLGDHVLEQDEQFDRYAQAVRIAGIWFVNLHPTPLGFFSRSYEEHEDVEGAAHARAIEQLLRSLVDGLRSAADGPIVLLGDFNTDNPRSVYQALIDDLGLAVALDPAAVTVPWGSAPDQVMATVELRTTHSGIVLTETDHYPVVVDLSLATLDSPPSPSAVRETPAEPAWSALDIPERKAWDIGTVPPPRGQRFDPGLVHAMGPHPEGWAVGGRGSRPTSGESAETAGPGPHESASRSTGSAGQLGYDSVDRIPASESRAINPAPESNAHTAAADTNTAPSHQLQQLIAQDVANGHAEQATRRVQEVFGDRVVQLAGSALGSRHAPEILEEVAGNVVAHLGQIGDRSLEEWVALVARNVIAEHRRIAEMWRSVQLFLVLGASLSESDPLIAAWNEATTADMRRELGALPAYHRAPLRRFQTTQRTTTATQLRPPSDPMNEASVLWDAARALGIAIAAGQGVPATLPVEPTPRRALTDRELEVNRLQAAGRTVAEIAESLHIAASTVRVLQSRIRTKLHPGAGVDSPTATSPESREAEATDTNTPAPEMRMLPGRDGLTGPEITVLTLLYQGLSLSEIATALRMEPRKVTYHRISAATKLGVTKSIPTVVEARRRGLLSSVVTASASPDTFGLNAKDMELLRLTAEGLTDEQLAERQQLTVRGISERRISLGKKLGVREKISIVMKALRLGLLDGDDHAVAAPKREAPPQHVESPEAARGDDAIPAPVETMTDGALIRHVLPDDVHAVETFGNERSSVLSVWLNAQQALQALGYGDEPIRTGADGSPLWPGDLTGATARTQKYAAVALGPAGTYRAISLDAKDHAAARLHRDSVVASAEDNVIDLYHRLTGQQLGHNQVEITVNPDAADAPAGTFEARLTADAATGPSLTTLSGRFRLQHGTLVTAITLRNDEGFEGSDPEGAVGPNALPELDLVSVTSSQLIELLDSRQITSVQLTQLCIQRIKALSKLKAVIGINPRALEEAARADELRRTGAAHGPLLGVPVLIKGSIDIAGMPTTAGSVALADSYPATDATLVAQLRAAGAVILGHGNLNEFAFYLSSTLPPGYSSYGGQTLNPFDSSLKPGGSSSGPAVGVAAGLVPLAVGTSTTGSVVGPANWNSIVGLKPTVGAVSRTGVLPIATTRDTPGAISPDVTGAAMLLTALVGVDPQDPATAHNPLAGHDFTADLNPEALRGTRIGVMALGIPSEDSAQRPLWDAALNTLKAQGATLITVDLDTSHSFQDNDPGWSSVFTYEFKRDLNAYLSRLPANAPIKNLADIIAYNNAHADKALKYGQDLALAAQAIDLGADSIDTAKYHADLQLDIAESKTRIDAVMAEHDLTALVSAYDYGTIMGDKAGYPAIVVPAGRTPADPDHPAGEHFSVSFRAAAWSEPTLIGYAYAFEQAHAVQRPRPQFADQLYLQATADNKKTTVATEVVTDSDDRQRSATVDGEVDAGRVSAAADGTAAPMRRPAAAQRVGLIGSVPDLVDPFDDRGKPWDRGGPVSKHKRMNRLVEPHADGGGFARGGKPDDPTTTDPATPPETAARPGWRPRRMRDEVELGRRLYHRPETREVTVAVLDRLRNLLGSLHPEAAPEEIDAAFYAPENERWGGMVKRSVSLAELRRDGNPRELMSAVLNAMIRNAELNDAAGTTLDEGLAKLLNRPDWAQKAVELGLSVAALRDVRASILRSKSTVTAPELRNVSHAVLDSAAARDAFAEYEGRLEASKNRTPDMMLRRHLTVQDWALLGMPLSQRELEAIPGELHALRIDRFDLDASLPRRRGRVDVVKLETTLQAEDDTVSHILPLYRYDENGNRVRDDAGDAVVDAILVYRDEGVVDAATALALDPDRYAVPLTWRPGVALVEFEPGSPWFREVAVERGIPLAAGISGSAARLMSRFNWLGLPKEWEEAFRGAVAAFMIPHHHTLYETELGMRMVGQGMVDESVFPTRGGDPEVLFRAARELPRTSVPTAPGDVLARRGQVPGFGAEAGFGLDVPERKKWDNEGAVPPPRGQRFDFGMLHAVDPNVGLDGHAFRRPGREHTDSAVHETESGIVGSAGQSGAHAATSDGIRLTPAGLIVPADPTRNLIVPDVHVLPADPSLEELMERLRPWKEIFWYFWEFPLPREGELSGRKWIESSERKAWMRRRAIRRTPLYAGVDAAVRLTLGAERLLNAPHATSGPATLQQLRVIPGRGEIDAEKKRTMRVDAQVRESNRADVEEMTAFEKFWRGVSGDELPQTKQIRQGDMAYVGGRLLRAEGHNLMVAGRYAEGYNLMVAGRDPVLTPEEYALWLMFSHDALWTVHYPGCRELEPQSPDFLLTRYLTVAIFDKIASKPLEVQYLDDVVRPYLRRQGVAAGRVLLNELSHHAMNSCRSTVEQLGMWALIGMGRKVGAEVEEHLDNCAACRNSAAALPVVDSRPGGRNLIVPPGPAGDGSTANLPASKHPTAPEPRDHEPETPAAERGEAVDTSPEATQRIGALQARMAEMNGITVRRHREDEAVSADRLNRAYNKIEAELDRLRATGKVIDDVPVVAGPDHQLAMDAVFHPQRAYERAYRDAMNGLLGYPLVRATAAPAEAQDRLAEIRRSIDRAAELAADAGRAEEVGEIEVLVTIFEWTEQADAGGRLILPENEQAEQRGAAAPETARQLLDSAGSDTGTATENAAANSMPAGHVRPEHDSVESRRERARHGGHRAALPDETVQAVPEPDETADLGRVANLYAARMPDGRTVHFRLLGHPYGYPVLLSPGTPVGIDGPLPDHRQLYDRGFTVIVVERPGYGDSDPLPGRTVADCARDIIHIATELFAFDRYSVLGRSGGGSVAIAVGALDPDHVDRVVSLVGTAPRLDDMGEWMAGMAEANQRIYARPDTEAMAATLTLMAENIARDGEWLLRYNQDAFTTMDHMWVGTHRDELARGYQRALRNYLQAWADDAIQLTGHWGIRFDQYRVPVDIVHGAADQFSPVDHSRNNARLIPTSKLYLFRGVSHMMGMDALPVIASHFRVERDAWANKAFRRDEQRIQAIRRAESDPLPFPKWMYWARDRWDSVPDYELDLPPQRARGMDGLGFDPIYPVADPFSRVPRGVPRGAFAHAVDPNLREDGAFAATAHTPAPTVAVQSGDKVLALEDPNTTPRAGSLPAPLIDSGDVANDPRTSRQAPALGPGTHAPLDPAAVLDLPPHRARGLDGLGFGPPPAVADPFGGVPRGVPDGVVAHAANPSDPDGGAFGGRRSEAERIASAALSTFRVEATFVNLQNWAARLSDDNLHHLLVGFARTVTEQIAAIHRGKPPLVTDSVIDPARLLGAIVTEATLRFGDDVPTTAPTTYRELFAIGSWLRANRRTVADLHAAMTAVLDAAFAVTRTSTEGRWSVAAAHHTVPAHIAEIARYIEEAGQHGIWPEEGSFPPDAALTTEHVPLVESFRRSGVRANATARMVTDWAVVLDALLRQRSSELFSPRYAAIFESLPIHAAALDRARTGSDRLFAATVATALPDLLDAAFYLLPTSNSAAGLDYLSQVDGLLAEATTRFTDSSAIYALQDVADKIHRLYEDIMVADSRRSPEIRSRRIHETLSDYFSIGSDSAITDSFSWGVRALWGLGSQQPGIDYAPLRDRLDADLPRDWNTTDDERALVATAMDLLRNVRGSEADIRSLLRQNDLFEDTFDSVGANMRWWYRLGRWTSGTVTIGSLLAGATDFSVSQMQLAVLRQYPHIIGAAPGIEYRARDLANRLSLARDLESSRVAPERRDALDALRDHLAEVRRDAHRLAIPGSSPPPVLLVSYDPVAEGGTGRAVISIGEADSATFMAFNVIGPDTRVADLSHWSERACQQYEKAQQHAPRGDRVAIMFTVGLPREIDAPSHTAEPDTTAMDSVVEARDIAGDLVARELITYDATRELALDGSDEMWNRMVRLATVIGHGDGIGVLRSAADTLHLSRAVDQIVLVPGSADDRLPTASQLNIGTEHVYTLNPHRDRNGDPDTIGLIMVGRGSDIESAPDTSSRSSAPLIETPTTVRDLSQLLPAHEYRPLEGIRGWTMTRDEGLTVYRAAQPLLHDALSGTYNTTVILEDLGLVLRIGQPDNGSYDPRFGPEHETLPVISRYVRNAPQLLKVITGRMPDGRFIDESTPILIERLARGDNLAETFRRADRRTIRSHQSLILRTFANVHEQLRAMPEDHPLLDRLTPPGVARGDTGGWYLNHIDWYTVNFYRQHYGRFGHLFDEFGLLRESPFEPLIDDARSMRESRHHVLHADPNEGNFLISNELRVTLLDWELSVTGPSAYDWARLSHLIPGIEVPRELGGPDMVKFARLEKFKRVMNDTVKLAPLAATGLLTPREIEFINTEFSEAVIQVRQLSGHTKLLPPRAELEILRSWRP